MGVQESLFTKLRSEAIKSAQSLTNRCGLLQRAVVQLERDLLDVSFQLEDARAGSTNTSLTSDRITTSTEA